MFFLSIVFSFAIFYPTKLILNRQIPSFLWTIIYVLSIFLILELILLIALLIDIHRFSKKSLVDKRKSIYEHMVKKAKKKFLLLVGDYI